MGVDINKIYDAINDVKKYNFNDQEIIKLIRELLYNIYEEQGNSEEYNEIHLYFLIRSCLDIYSQMLAKRKFDALYLKNTLKF